MAFFCSHYSISNASAVAIIIGLSRFRSYSPPPTSQVHDDAEVVESDLDDAAHVPTNPTSFRAILALVSDSYLGMYILDSTTCSSRRLD